MALEPTVNVVPGATLLSGWRYRAVVWSVTIAAAGYLGFALWTGWENVTHAVGKVGAFGVVITLSLSLVNYTLRFIRWQAYLRALGHGIPWWPSWKIYIAGFALTTTPGKAGEALRGVLLRHWGISYVQSIAAFLSERLSDLVAVIMLALLGLTVYPAAQPLIAIGAGGILAAFLILSSESLLEGLRGVIRGESRVASLVRHLFVILLQARRCHSPALLAGATGLSLIAWASEAWAFYLITHWMGLDISPAFAVFIYATSMLAGALSFMPGGLGGAEAVMVGLLVWKGVIGSDAIAATILIRVATLWFAVAIGCLTLIRQTSGRLEPAADS